MTRASVHDPFALARRMKTPVWVYDTDRNQMAYANDAALEVWKAESEEELKARDLGDGMSSTVAKRLQQYQADFTSRDAEFSEIWTIYPNGEPRTLNVIYTGFRLPDGRMAMMCEATGEGKDKPEALRSAEALLHTDVMIALYSLDGTPLYQNPAARNAAPEGFSRFAELFALKADYAALEKRWRTAEECRQVSQVRTASGTLWHDFSVKKCLDAATGDQALLVTAVDVTELKEARDKARYLANRDQLTGCYNRSFIQYHVEEVTSRQQSTGQSHALLVLDVDRFKLINDTFGHEAGDDVLVEFASRIQEHVRGSDLVARLGGDEFLVLLHELDGEDNLERRLGQLTQRVRKPFQCGNLQLDVSTSIGAVMFEADDLQDLTGLMKKADIALYQSKRLGRDRFTVYSDALGEEMQERLWMEGELRSAFKTHAFSLHYQPRFDAKTQKIVSAEALIRWEHPERGFIPPDDFIPLCEEIGLIDQLGDFVCHEACRQLNAWHRQGIDIGLSINVSPKQFQSDRIVDLFEGIAKSASFPTHRLELEITESSLLGGDAQVTKKLRKIADLGFKIALDDFGTGYSNLMHISRLPLQCVKLDKSFIQKLPQTGPLLRLVFALASQIGATTVAEGVETPEQLEWLQRHDCDQLQGFFLARPMPADELLNLLARRGQEQGLSEQVFKKSA